MGTTAGQDNQDAAGDGKTHDDGRRSLDACATLRDLLQLGLTVAFAHGGWSLRGNRDTGMVEIAKRGKTLKLAKFSDGNDGVDAALAYVATRMREDNEPYGILGEDTLEAAIAAAPPLGSQWDDGAGGRTLTLAARAVYDCRRPPRDGMLVDVMEGDGWDEAGWDEAFPHDRKQKGDLAGQAGDAGSFRETPKMTAVRLQIGHGRDMDDTAMAIAILADASGARHAVPMHHLVHGPLRKADSEANDDER